jgi:hypothetical protein
MGASPHMAPTYRLNSLNVAAYETKYADQAHLDGLARA